MSIVHIFLLVFLASASATKFADCGPLCDDNNDGWYKLDWETKIGPHRKHYKDCVFFGPHSECTKCAENYEKEQSSLFMTDVFKSSLTADDEKHMLLYLETHNLCVPKDGVHINAQDMSITKKQFKDTYLIRRAQYLVLKSYYSHELKRYNVLKEAYRSTKKTLSKLDETDPLQGQYAKVYNFYKHKYDVAYNETETMYKQLKRAEFVQKAAGDQYIAVFKAILGQQYPEHRGLTLLKHKNNNRHTNNRLTKSTVDHYDQVVSKLWST